VRSIRLLCLFFGGFLLTAAVFAQAWLPGHVLRTPLSVDNTTRLSGTAESILFAGTQPVKVLSRTQVIPGLSTGSTAAWGSWSCVTIATPGAPDCPRSTDSRWKLVNASADTYASSRTSGEGIANSAALPRGIAPATGLVNKFPFEAQKTDYPYWDDTLGSAATARYDRTTKLDGLTTYVYTMTVPTTPVEISPGTAGTYANTTTFYVEPLTGAIINQVTDLRTTLSDGSTALAMKISFTPDQIASGIADGKHNRFLIILVLKVAPITLGLLGLALLAGGFVLTVRARRSQPDLTAAPKAPKAPRAKPRLPLRGAHA
jgi:hypothetical protein